MNNQNDGQSDLSFLLHSRLDLTGKTGVERQLPDLMVVDSVVRAGSPVMTAYDNVRQDFLMSSATFPCVAMFDDQALS